ncbi:MAG: biotin--[Lachnospiraceae bacterium]|nr:biotin--[acetyl-CoA-carboxylase] ligase [Lachnospiraceae bacterium]
MHLDTIDPIYIENKLKSTVSGIRVIFKDETGSTNEDALSMLAEGSGPVLVIADKQLKGRGRRGRDFYSPKGTGLYLSLAMPGAKELMETGKVTATAAVAVATAIDEAVFSGISTSLIKWVNDIYLGDRKVCGILTEARLPVLSEANDDTKDDKGCVVVGIGVNVYEPEGGFPEGIADKAGYLIPLDRVDEMMGLRAQHVGERTDHAFMLRSELAAGIVRNFFHYLNRQDESLKIYREKSNLIGSAVRINTFADPDIPQRIATVLGIDDDCGLIVEYEDGSREVLSSGEVSVIKN